MKESKKERFSKFKKELSELQKTLIDILYFKLMLPKDISHKSIINYKVTGNNYEVRHADFIIIINERQMKLLRIECLRYKVKLIEDIKENPKSNKEVEKDNSTYVEISSELYESSDIDDSCFIDGECKMCIGKIQSIEDLKSLKRHLLQKSFIKRIGNYKIYKNDLVTLLGSNWLSDKIINSYCLLLQAKHKEKNIYFLTTYFYTSLIKLGHERVDKWFLDIKLTSYNSLIIPIHLGNHWILAYVDNIKKTIKIFDSLGGYNRKVAVTLVDWIARMALKDGFTNVYTFFFPTDIVRQTNGNDCGVFVLYYIMNLCEYDKVLPKTYLNTRVLRLQIMHEIRIGKIIYDIKIHNMQ